MCPTFFVPYEVPFLAVHKTAHASNARAQSNLKKQKEERISVPEAFLSQETLKNKNSVGKSSLLDKEKSLDSMRVACVRNLSIGIQQPPPRKTETSSENRRRGPRGYRNASTL